MLFEWWVVCVVGVGGLKCFQVLTRQNDTLWGVRVSSWGNSVNTYNNPELECWKGAVNTGKRESITTSFDALIWLFWKLVGKIYGKPQPGVSLRWREKRPLWVSVGNCGREEPLRGHFSEAPEGCLTLLFKCTVSEPPEKSPSTYIYKVTFQFQLASHLLDILFLYGSISLFGKCG